MQKRLNKLIFLVIIFISMMSRVIAKENKNLVNVYLFYSDTCYYCSLERDLWDDLVKKYDNIRVYEYEVSSDENIKLLDGVSELFDTSVTRVPVTIIGEKLYKGFSYEDSKARFMAVIEYYSEYGYTDIVGEYIGGIELPSYLISDDRPDIENYIDDYMNYKINIPILGTVNTKNLTLPVVSVLIGLVDGFNPCAMWVLLFLISMLIGIKDRKKMFILGLSFLISSALIYLLLMLAWLNVASLLLSINYIRVIIGIVALAGAFINIFGYIRHRSNNGCSIVSYKKRNKVFSKIRKFVHEKNLLLAISGVIALAISVNIVELACSAGLPVMFVQILSMNNLTFIEEVLYIALYMLFFLLDDIVVFFIAFKTMEMAGFSTKYGKIAKLVGGIILLMIGILLIFRPEWLMFNFG